MILCSAMRIAVLAGFLPTGLAIGSLQDQSRPSAPTVSTRGSPQCVRLVSGLMTDRLVKKVKPKYPAEARQEGAHDMVVLRATINTRGQIADLAVLSGDVTLVEAAMEALKQWKFDPYRMKGKPVEVETLIQLNVDP